MSIATRSVLRRILADALRGRAPGATRRFVDAEDARLEWHRVSGAAAARYATGLHFWAGSLVELLDGFGRHDLFDALAGHCLCEALSPAEVCDALAPLRPVDAPPLAPVSRVRAGYRMADQDVFGSWLAEDDRGYTAVFRASRPWLERARPLLPEEDGTDRFPSGRAEEVGNG